jgi:hypothetical protein
MISTQCEGDATDRKSQQTAAEIDFLDPRLSGREAALISVEPG